MSNTSHALSTPHLSAAILSAADPNSKYTRVTLHEATQRRLGARAAVLDKHPRDIVQATLEKHGCGEVSMSGHSNVVITFAGESLAWLESTKRKYGTDPVGLVEQLLEAELADTPVPETSKAVLV